MDSDLHFGFTLGARSIAIASAIVILAIALFTRLYALGSFPYFPPITPWNGAHVDQPSLQGLYADEYNYMQIGRSLIGNPPHFSLYQPPLALFLLGISTRILGVNVFAVRLPFAIFSALTTVFVYLIASRLSNSRILGFGSALFYIAMVPALVYGRMAFLDNFSAFFFIAMFYFLLRFKDSQLPVFQHRWLLAASFFAGFSMLAKVTGAVSLLFLLLFLYKDRSLRRSSLYILPALVLAALFPLIILAALDFNPFKLVGLFATQHQYDAFLVGNEIGIWRYFLLSTLPSGYTTWWGGLGGFPKPEFWYILGYVALFSVLMKEYSKYSSLILSMGAFIAFITVVAPLGSYYLIFLQPLLSIPFGPGIRRMLDMPIPATLGVYSFLYVPLAISLGINVVTGTSAGNPLIDNPLLFLWKFLLVLIPLAVLFLSLARFEENPQWRRACNSVLILMLLAVLFAASYLSPDLYPQYFYPKAFTP